LVDGKLTVRSSRRRIRFAANGVTAWYILRADVTADICNKAYSTAAPKLTGSRTEFVVIIPAKPGEVFDSASHRVRGAVDDVNWRISLCTCILFLCKGSLEKAYDGKDLNKFHDVALIYIYIYIFVD
jgi:hypothetical protein